MRTDGGELSRRRLLLDHDRDRTESLGEDGRQLLEGTVDDGIEVDATVVGTVAGIHECLR